MKCIKLSVPFNELDPCIRVAQSLTIITENSFMPLSNQPQAHSLRDIHSSDSFPL